MEFAFVSFLSQSLIVAAFTLLFCAISAFAVRLLPLKSQSWESVSGKIAPPSGSDFASRREGKSFNCCSTCEAAALSAGLSKSLCDKVANGSGADMCEKKSLAAPVLQERLTGASMMEQLVPEITTHALSYLDFPSLCRLSMTNSLMRKAANDDNAWKTLYHKDFTMEQTSVKPPNGWKAYYAATRAIVNVNADFFNIIRERSLQAMSRLWLDADYVKCIHTSGELFTGGKMERRIKAAEGGILGKARVELQQHLRLQKVAISGRNERSSPLMLHPTTAASDADNCRFSVFLTSHSLYTLGFSGDGRAIWGELYCLTDSFNFQLDKQST